MEKDSEVEKESLNITKSLGKTKAFINISNSIIHRGKKFKKQLVQLNSAKIVSENRSPITA